MHAKQVLDLGTTTPTHYLAMLWSLWSYSHDVKRVEFTRHVGKGIQKKQVYVQVLEDKFCYTQPSCF